MGSLTTLFTAEAIKNSEVYRSSIFSFLSVYSKVRLVVGYGLLIFTLKTFFNTVTATHDIGV